MIWYVHPGPDFDFFTHTGSRSATLPTMVQSLLIRSFRRDFFDIIYGFLHFSALEALRKKEISANKAAKVYKIPSSTLYKIARCINLYLFSGNRYGLCALGTSDFEQIS